MTHIYSNADKEPEKVLENKIEFQVSQNIFKYIIFIIRTKINRNEQLMSPS